MRCHRIIILAAGRARRLKASVSAGAASGREWPAIMQADALNRSKPMVRVGEPARPMISWLLGRAIAAGFSEATLVAGKDDELIGEWAKEWCGRPYAAPIRVRIVRQEAPLGTADALREALELDPLPPGQFFALCNGDNLPTVPALIRLRQRGDGMAMLAYDPKSLGLPEDRVRSFAVVHTRDDGSLDAILEKPGPEMVERLRGSDGVSRVSMNLFRLEYGAMLRAVQDCPKHPERGEKELPTAVTMMLGEGLRVEGLSESSPVLDMTSLGDVVEASKVLKRTPRRLSLEVCAGTPEDVAVSLEAGADRVELCSHWECGGLTPTTAAVRAACREGLPVHALVRPRAGHLVYTGSERELYLAEAQSMLEAGAARVVVGALTPDGHLDRGLLESLLTLCGPERLVHHRALDATSDWDAAITDLTDLGILQVLTSGGAPTAWAAQDRIGQLVRQGFHVAVGSGVQAEHVPTWRGLGVRSAHASCRLPVPAPANHPSALFDGTTHPVDPLQVRALALACHSFLT